MKHTVALVEVRRSLRNCSYDGWVAGLSFFLAKQVLERPFSISYHCFLAVEYSDRDS